MKIEYQFVEVTSSVGDVSMWCHNENVLWFFNAIFNR